MGETVGTILKTIGIMGILFFGVRACVNSDWSRANDARNEAEARARQTPHVIREADGCKVYAFERGGVEHYFTRCGEQVSTERNYKEACGKGCTKQKQETIVTEGNK
jgi:hypothetical protein